MDDEHTPFSILVLIQESHDGAVLFYGCKTDIVRRQSHGRGEINSGNI